MIMTKYKDDTQPFLGFANYLVKFMPGLSDMAKPLIELCEQSMVFSFDTLHPGYFETIRRTDMQGITLQ